MPPKTKKLSPHRGRKRAPRQTATTPPPLPTISPWAARACAAAVFLAVFIVYLHTLLPTVVDQDSGELVSAAHVLGVPHPTGYPMWTLLAWLFDHLPVGPSSAYRVGLLSAVSVSAAAGVLTWITITLSGAYVAGIFAGLAFGFWLPCWSQAVIAEVYGLEGLLTALFPLALWWWDRERTPRRLAWLALAAGMAGAHHRIGALIVLPVLAVACWQTRPARVKSYLQALACAAAPFLFYIYLPLRAAAKPAMNWGNPDTWERFLDHVSGKQYSFLAFSQTNEAALKQAAKLLRESLVAPGWPALLVLIVGALLIAWGIGHWLRRRPWITTALVAGSAALVIFILYYGAAEDSKVWLIPVGAVLAVFGGIGMSRLGSYLPGKFSGSAAAAVLGLTVTGLLLSANWSQADQSNRWGFRDTWAANVAELAPNSIFIADQDMALGVTIYLQVAEGRGRGVTALSPTMLWIPWYPGQLKDPELRAVATKSWQQAADEYQLEGNDKAKFRNAVARFAYLLAQHYRGQRTIYSPHFPVNAPPTPAPYYFGLRDGINRMDFTLPNLTRPAAPHAASPLATSPAGVRLMSLTFTPAAAKPGDLVTFRAQWQHDGPLPGQLFALRMVPAHPAQRPTWNRLLMKAAFNQGYPVLHGLWGSPPTAPGTVQEQTAHYLLPTNAPPRRLPLRNQLLRPLPPRLRHLGAVGGGGEGEGEGGAFAGRRPIGSAPCLEYPKGHPPRHLLQHPTCVFRAHGQGVLSKG